MSEITVTVRVLIPWRPQTCVVRLSGPAFSVREALEAAGMDEAPEHCLFVRKEHACLLHDLLHDGDELIVLAAVDCG